MLKIVLSFIHKGLKTYVFLTCTYSLQSSTTITITAHVNVISKLNYFCDTKTDRPLLQRNKHQCSLVVLHRVTHLRGRSLFLSCNYKFYELPGRHLISIEFISHSCNLQFSLLFQSTEQHNHHTFKNTSKLIDFN